MNKREGQKNRNYFRRIAIETRGMIPYPKKFINDGSVLFDFMSEAYMIDHIHLIKFMNCKTTQDLIRSKISSAQGGYVEVYIKKTGEIMNPYLISFTPSRIISKYWGLGFKGANPRDFIYFECLDANDYTKFRGCFKK